MIFLYVIFKLNTICFCIFIEIFEPEYCSGKLRYAHNFFLWPWCVCARAFLSKVKPCGLVYIYKFPSQSVPRCRLPFELSYPERYNFRICPRELLQRRKVRFGQRVHKLANQVIYHGRTF